MDDLGLEPLEPFLDDVFAGLHDDSAPGGVLWHPTLSCAPPGAATHHQDAVPSFAGAAGSFGSASISSQEGLDLPYDDMLQAPELPLELLPPLQPHWELQQPEQQQEQTVAAQWTPQLAEQQPPVECTAGSPTEAEVQALLNASIGNAAAGSSHISMSTARDAAAEAAEGLASCPCEIGSYKQLSSNHGCTHGSQYGINSQLAAEEQQQHAELEAVTPSPPAPAPAPAAAAAEDGLPAADGTAAALTSSMPAAADAVAESSTDEGGGSGGSPRSEESVPDIDDVAEEQTTLQQQTVLQQQPVSQQQQQQQQQQALHVAVQQEPIAQQHQQQDVLLSPLGDNALEQNSRGVHSAQQQQQQQQQSDGCPWSQQHEQQAACQSGAADGQSGGADEQGLLATAEHVANAAEANAGAAQANARVPPPRMIEPAATGPQAPAEAGSMLSANAAAAAAAAADGVEGCDGLDEFASPHTSWMSCMTSASHASAHSAYSAAASTFSAAHSVLSAASFASAAPRDGALGLATLLPRQQQQQWDPEHAAAAGVAAVLAQTGATRNNNSSSSSSGSGWPVLAVQRAAAHDAAEAAAAPVPGVAVDSTQLGQVTAAAANSSQQGPVAIEDAGQTAAAAAAVSSVAAAVADGDPLGASLLQQQQASPHWPQQQQQVAVGAAPHEEEVWQDVLPPSLSSSPPSPGYTTVEAHHATEDAGLGEAEQPAAAAAEEAEDDGDVGHGHYYASSAAPAAHSQRSSPSGSSICHNGSSIYPYGYPTAAGGSGPQHYAGFPGYGAGHAAAAAAASTYVLRQSELVDLSLSTSVHPAQQQQQQHVRPGWLAAHQALPPAAAQAVERAVCALNDSYFYHGRQSAEHGGSSIASNPSPANRHSSAAGSSNAGSGMAASGVIGMGIRRTVAGQQWSATHTHPQQDQQARHRLPSQHAAAGANPFGAWPGPAVLGQWFSSTVQHPLAAATGRVAAGVGQRIGSAAAAAAAGVSSATSQGPQALLRAGGSSSSRVGSSSTAGMAAAAGSSGSRTGVPATGSDTTSSTARTTAVRSSSSIAATANHQGAAAAAGGGGGAAAGAWDVGWGPDSFEDAVLVEHTPDLPQSLQEQEDEAFRGLLFLGGRDSHGRPVVIVNTDAIPVGPNPAPRDAALAYLIKRLTPVVTRGPYVLVLVAFHHGPHFRLLPGVWCVRAYQTLPRAFRKNVKHMLLLQPSLMVRAALALLYPFVSSKAHAKVKQVHRLLDIEAATAGEVQVAHLGEAFLTAQQHLARARSAPPAAAHGLQPPGSRTVPVPGAVIR